MRVSLVSMSIRLIGLIGVLTLITRPLIAAELTPQLAVAMDALVLGSAAISLALARRHLGRLRPLAWPLAAWAGAICLGLLAHGLTARAWPQLLAFIGGPLILCAAAIGWGAWRRVILRGAVLVALGISLFALWQYVVILPDLAAGTAGAVEFPDSILHEVAARGRVLGTFALPTLLAAHLTVAWLLGVGLAARRQSSTMLTVAWWLGCALILAAWVLTRSLGAWLSLAAAASIALWHHRWRRTLLLGSLLLVGCGVVMVAGRSHLRDYASPHHPVHSRLTYWDAAWSMIRAHPVRGVGPGGFAERYHALTREPQRGARHAHNTYLQIWAEWGVGALVAFGWLMLAILRRARFATLWLLAAIWTLPLHNLVDFSFYVPQVSWLWWCVAGWSLRRPRITSRPLGRT